MRLISQIDTSTAEKIVPSLTLGAGIIRWSSKQDLAYAGLQRCASEVLGGRTIWVFAALPRSKQPPTRQTGLTWAGQVGTTFAFLVLVDAPVRCVGRCTKRSRASYISRHLSSWAFRNEIPSPTATSVQDGADRRCRQMQAWRTRHLQRHICWVAGLRLQLV